MALINTSGSGDLLSGLITLLADPKTYAAKLTEFQNTQNKVNEKLGEMRTA